MGRVLLPVSRGETTVGKTWRYTLISCCRFQYHLGLDMNVVQRSAQLSSIPVDSAAVPTFL
jgi:hypothetical protein